MARSRTSTSIVKALALLVFAFVALRGAWPWLRTELGLGETTLTTTSKTGVPSDFPGGGLAAHEKAGGHTLARHVGKSDSDLLSRLANEPNISAAGGFPSREVAEAAIGELLRANQDRIASWLRGSKDRLVLNGRSPEPVGRYIAQGTLVAKDVKGVRVVLVRRQVSDLGYVILTAYPKP